MNADKQAFEKPLFKLKIARRRIKIRFGLGRKSYDI